MLTASLAGCGYHPVTTGVQLADPGRCVPVDVAAAPETAPLLDTAAARFNGSAARAVARRRVRVRPRADGRLPGRAPRARRGLARHPERLGPAPAAWVPGSTMWTELLNARLADDHRGPIAPTGTPFAAHAARRRDAGADGERARLPAPADRVERPRTAGPRPPGLGRVRASRMGTVPARQGQPELVDDRPRPDRRTRRVAARVERARLASNSRSSTTATPRRSTSTTGAAWRRPRPPPRSATCRPRSPTSAPSSRTTPGTSRTTSRSPSTRPAPRCRSSRSTRTTPRNRERQPDHRPRRGVVVGRRP